jgi:hypothetical protein
MATALRLNEATTTNDAAELISLEVPYIVEVTIEGVADILFHRWSNEAVEAKAKAAKGSAAKKTDDLESYVYRTPNGNLALPGEYVRQSVIGAAKFRQDPRSPRKSAMDLFKAGVVSLDPLIDLGVSTWDYEDRRRAVVQRNAVTRVRPALRTGWRATARLMVLVPEYIDPPMLNATVQAAGRLIGVADFRPTYGRFMVVRFDVQREAFA